MVTRDVPTMPGGHPLLGHALEFGRDPLALFQRAREHGDVVRIRFGPFRVYVLNSPDAIRQALVGEARKLSKGLNFGRAKRLIGGGLVMAEGEGHQRQRRLMQPAFHRAEIARYAGTMRMSRCRASARWPDGGTLAFDREMRSITLTVLTRTLLSSDIGADGDRRDRAAAAGAAVRTRDPGDQRECSGPGVGPDPLQPPASALPTGACAPC